ncbi:SRPBCC domain-containing protein [Catellatospora vulcania]|uniref:SRPBCC domain-containing protein n=1 Tax=Catellatospora vulcania TaxID=1460450 RepID=UPI001E5EDC36|nr:SRPBCC domain-containing protein [Catellatospora vulcania]
MTATGTAVAEIEVACDPATAFTVFTADIGTWWKRGTHYWNDPERGRSMRFEPQVGGRFIEVYDDGEGYELGRVQVWEPGERLVFGWRTADWAPGVSTSVEVRFTPVAGGTRVTIEHSGWEQFGAGGAGSAEGYGKGWAELLGWYAEQAR